MDHDHKWTMWRARGLLNGFFSVIVFRFCFSGTRGTIRSDGGQGDGVDA